MFLERPILPAHSECCIYALVRAKGPIGRSQGYRRELGLSPSVLSICRSWSGCFAPVVSGVFSESHRPNFPNYLSRSRKVSNGVKGHFDVGQFDFTNCRNHPPRNTALAALARPSHCYMNSSGETTTATPPVTSRFLPPAPLPPAPC